MAVQVCMFAEEDPKRYEHPGSFARVQEAAIALAECDSEDDVAYERCKDRLRKAVLAWRVDP